LFVLLSSNLDKRAGPFEGKGNHIPWLRRWKPDGEVQLLNMKTKTARPATPEEIEAGRFFKDEEECRKFTSKWFFRTRPAAKRAMMTIADECDELAKRAENRRSGIFPPRE
jgi:hypothetical protein